MTSPVLLVHGGTTRREVKNRTARAEALKAVADSTWEILAGGGSALDAVTHAVTMLEDFPLFNAGTGSTLQSDGVARMSASLMDGRTARFSGVVNVQHVQNPIALCRHLQDDVDRVLSEEGALARARELGLDEKDVRTPRSIRRWKEGLERQGKGPRGTGTVGAVALDATGAVAAATSTGGRGMERVGRVSDSATAAGNYASGQAAVSCTGIGEDIVDGGLAVRFVQLVEAGLKPPQARQRLLRRMDERGWQAGFVGLDDQGGWAVGATTKELFWWYRGLSESRGFIEDD